MQIQAAAPPQKVKNVFAFNLVQFKKIQAADHSTNQAAIDTDMAADEKSPRMALPSIEKPSGTEETDPTGTNRVNTDYLQNALYSEVVNQPMEYLQRNGARVSIKDINDEPLAPQTGGLSSPFVVKAKEMQQTSSLAQRDPNQQLFPMKNPASYIHGQIKKKVYKHVAQNFTQAPYQHLKSTSNKVILEGFTD